MLRLLPLAAMLLIGLPIAGQAQMTTEDSVKKTLESDGYQDVRDIKFTSDGITAKAVKDGKQVSVVVDSTGKVMQRNW
jgi:hypothetical protein